MSRRSKTSKAKPVAPTTESPVLSRRAMFKRAAAAAVLGGAVAVAVGVAPVPHPRRPKWIGHC